MGEVVDPYYNPNLNAETFDYRIGEMDSFRRGGGNVGDDDLGYRRRFQAKRMLC